LWATENATPDIGGAETDEYSLWSDPLTEPIVNTPGAHRSICVELEVIFLTAKSYFEISDLTIFNY
jgi:hypothetical protein